MFRNLLTAATSLLALAAVLAPVAGADPIGPAAVPGTDYLMAQMVEGPKTTQWGYLPLSSTVPAGQSLTWTNIGQIPHTATDDAGAWDTGNVAPGATATLTFNTPGTYAYHCTLHPWMKATVVVIPAAPADDGAPAAPAVDNETSDNTGMGDSAPAG